VDNQVTFTFAPSLPKLMATHVLMTINIAIDGYTATVGVRVLRVPFESLRIYSFVGIPG
jgi:hypothetical protein